MTKSWLKFSMFIFKTCFNTGETEPGSMEDTVAGPLAIVMMVD